jgi:hypothetical protein
MPIIQSVIFDKSYISLDDAITWIIQHNFKILKVDETKNKYRFRQENPNLLKKKGYQKVITKKINNYIEFIIYYKI